MPPAPAIDWRWIQARTNNTQEMALLHAIEAQAGALISVSRRRDRVHHVSQQFQVVLQGLMQCERSELMCCIPLAAERLEDVQAEASAARQLQRSVHAQLCASLDALRTYAAVNRSMADEIEGEGLLTRALDKRALADYEEALAARVAAQWQLNARPTTGGAHPAGAAAEPPSAPPPAVGEQVAMAGMPQEPAAAPAEHAPTTRPDWLGHAAVSDLSMVHTGEGQQGVAEPLPGGRMAPQQRRPQLLHSEACPGDASQVRGARGEQSLRMDASARPQRQQPSWEVHPRPHQQHHKQQHQQQQRRSQPSQTGESQLGPGLQDQPAGRTAKRMRSEMTAAAAAAASGDGAAPHSAATARLCAPLEAGCMPPGSGYTQTACGDELQPAHVHSLALPEGDDAVCTASERGLDARDCRPHVVAADGLLSPPPGLPAMTGVCSVPSAPGSDRPSSQEMALAGC